MVWMWCFLIFGICVFLNMMWFIFFCVLVVWYIFVILLSNCNCCLLCCWVCGLLRIWSICIWWVKFIISFFLLIVLWLIWILNLICLYVCLNCCVKSLLVCLMVLNWFFMIVSLYWYLGMCLICVDVLFWMLVILSCVRISLCLFVLWNCFLNWSLCWLGISVIRFMYVFVLKRVVIRLFIWVYCCMSCWFCVLFMWCVRCFVCLVC